MAPPLRGIACRDCGLIIAWVVIEETGKRWPINMTADPNGRVFWFGKGWHARSRHLSPPAAVSLYVPHFSTCIGKRNRVARA